MTELRTFGYQLHLAANRGGVLRVGSDRRNEIRALQEALSAWAPDSELQIDGIFGPQTKKLLKEFQEAKGLDATGMAGEKTLQKLANVEPREVDPAESTNPSISAAKSAVPSGTVKKKKSGSGSSSGGSSKSGKSGPKTVKVNGVETNVDPRTGKPIATSATGPIGSTEQGAYGPVNQDFEKLHPRAGKGQSNGGQFIKKGDSGQNVQNVQKSLNQQGYNLKVDGQFGPKTEQAVKNFQAQNQDKQGNSLAVDGIVGFKTAGSLKRAAQKGQV